LVNGQSLRDIVTHLPIHHYRQVRVPLGVPSARRRVFWTFAKRAERRQVGDVTVVLSRRRRNESPKHTKLLVTNLPQATAHLTVALYLRRWPVAVSRVKTCLSNRWKSGRGKRSAPRSGDGRVVGNLSPEAHRQDLRNGRGNSPGGNSRERRGSLVTRGPVAETVDNARRQQAAPHLIYGGGAHRRGISGDLARETDRETGEAFLALGRKPPVEAHPITVSGKWEGRPEGGGVGGSTADPGAAKRRGREEPRPTGDPSLRGGSVR
jgi:hypothetical protein